MAKCQKAFDPYTGSIRIRESEGRPMAAGENQKLKMLYLVKIFSEQTDDGVFVQAAAPDFNSGKRLPVFLKKQQISAVVGGGKNQGRPAGTEQMAEDPVSLGGAGEEHEIKHRGIPAVSP
jgi:hypothetical protein